MMREVNLRIPGPTPCPPRVLRATSRQMINHRGREFTELLRGTTVLLKCVFETDNDVLIMTSSGTGAMEAAIVNTLSPGDRVLALSCGAFGDRFTEIAKAHGANVTAVTVPWGEAIDPSILEIALRNIDGVRAVLVTHNETSTGVTNDLEQIAKIVKGRGKLLLVDAISSLGAIPVKTDEWGLDVVIAASQKGWMAPPGLAMVSVSNEAWSAHKSAKMPRFYFDFAKAKSFLDKGQTPWTPAVSVLYGLGAGAGIMLKEGRYTFERHRFLAKMTRDGIRALGLELFAKNHYSDVVTAVKVPEGIDAKNLISRLREEHGVVVAGGQGKLSGKIFRIAHLGWVTTVDIDHALKALEQVLSS